jgi:hypothetical protein
LIRHLKLAFVGKTKLLITNVNYRLGVHTPFTQFISGCCLNRGKSTGRFVGIAGDDDAWNLYCHFAPSQLTDETTLATPSTVTDSPTAKLACGLIVSAGNSVFGFSTQLPLH